MLGRFRVVKRHTSDMDQPLVLSKGEHILWKRRPTRWVGWVWVEKKNGCGGWVPEAWMTMDRNSATMTRDYDAIELTVEEGDFVQGTLAESGWLLAKDMNGRLGWVPLDCVESAS